jgi:hypothetical protein
MTKPKEYHLICNDYHTFLYKQEDPYLLALALDGDSTYSLLANEILTHGTY